MGLHEYLRKQIARITGKDPEAEDSSLLYRFYQSTGPSAPGVPTSGTAPFKHFAASPSQTPPGWYYDPTGKLMNPMTRLSYGPDAMIIAPCFPADSVGSTRQIFLAPALNDPYNSDGTSTYYGNLTVATAMLAKSVLFTVANDGSVAPTALLGAAGGGKKWTLYDVHVSGLCNNVLVAGSGGAGNIGVTISDSVGYAATGAPLLGPVKQATANTAITFSSVAGQSSPSDLGGAGTITIRYRTTV